jgi:hypothetical protein
MVISQGDIWWAALPEPVGSGPGFDRPVVIAQGDTFNRSPLAAVVVIPLPSNTRLAAHARQRPPAIWHHGSAQRFGGQRDSDHCDRSLLTERIGHVSQRHLELR